MPRRDALIWVTAFSALSAQAAPPDDTIWTDPSSGIQFVAAPPGCFRMGNPDALNPDDNYEFQQLAVAEYPNADEAPTHEVCLDGFWISRHEIQAQEWQRVMGFPPPSGSGSDPAAGISWQQAQQFIAKLNLISTGTYQLPSEAEWEYACRAGEDPPALDTTALLEVAWFSARERQTRTPSAVGRLHANNWGIHDMLGNLWEWSADSYMAEGYLEHSRFNPRVDRDENTRVIRGGSYRSQYREISCTNRSHYASDDALPQFGLRLIRRGE